MMTYEVAVCVFLPAALGMYCLMDFHLMAMKAVLFASKCRSNYMWDVRKKLNPVLQMVLDICFGLDMEVCELNGESRLKIVEAIGIYGEDSLDVTDELTRQLEDPERHDFETNTSTLDFPADTLTVRYMGHGDPKKRIWYGDFCVRYAPIDGKIQFPPFGRDVPVKKGLGTPRVTKASYSGHDVNQHVTRYAGPLCDFYMSSDALGVDKNYVGLYPGNLDVVWNKKKYLVEEGDTHLEIYN